MRDFTLRKQFTIGIVIVIMVSILVLWGNRIVGKGALFHYLERNHLELVLKMDAIMTLVEQEAKNRTSFRREDFLKYIDEAIVIAEHGDYELVYVEKASFRLFGFEAVFEIATKDVKDLIRLKAIVNESQGTGISPALVAAMRPTMAQILDNSAKYGPEVLRAVEFGKFLAIFLTLFSFSTVGLLLWMLRQSVLGPITTALVFAKRIAKGDLSGVISSTSKNEFGDLLLALNEMNGNLAHIVGEVRNSTHVISDATKNVSSGNAELSAHTDSQSGAIRDTTVRMADMTNTVNNNAENASQANRLVLTAVEVAARGNDVVTEVVSTMGHISASSNKINDIIGVIDGIAFQTNILALNAAVEAARAGEQGRGFAVVAAEVRSLAQRSASAAKEIKQLISDSAQWVQTGSRLVEEAGKTMDEIGVSVKRVTDIMGEISQASQVQTAGIVEINQSLLEMENITHQNESLVDHAVTTANSLDEQVLVLKGAVGVFKLR